MAKYCRINLSATNYQESLHCKILNTSHLPAIREIYSKYCAYKKFDSVVPVFDWQYTASNVELLGYYINDRLVAYSHIILLDGKNCECSQFAWDYEDPSLELGIRSLQHECAYYKQRGYQYYYLGQYAKYKQQLDGFEILGKLCN
jgi:hypothetical protein